jgi:hypothetical protein
MSDQLVQDKSLYDYSTQNTNGCELVSEAAHYHIVLISQNCNFMLVKFTYFRMLIL